MLATAAVHNHLIRRGLRTSVGLVVETGEAREVHQFCVLAGYGAEAINPYLAFETLLQMHAEEAFPEVVDADEVVYRFIKSIGKGILKVMSKMGISTYQSYCGAQIFDAVGLSSAFVHRFFFGTSTTIEGAGLAEIAEETVRRHTAAFGEDPVLRNALDVGGEYAFRLRGEDHIWTPEAVALLQHAVRGKGVDTYRQYAALVNSEVQRNFAIRGLFRLRNAEEVGLAPVPLDEVEPAAEIVKRFSTGAMSFGSISREAHETLAIAMNRIGGKSNTGEGGEEAERFRRLPNGNSKRSAIKQVASGRFGVTAEYLVNSDMMQIKIAQGAKPGEGGQLPGHKVDAVIAKVRHSTPGVGLISPPPHHDIYSIEDIAQLIFDLKNVNPDGMVSVKLVSEVGVGTVAAGVAKARSDHITIAGYDGGTGASPLTSLKHAGIPWEIGLAETQQILVENGLRSRIALQVDGGLKTGRDVVIGALLGADEFGFATAPLIAIGCIMMRKCHLNTCPVGIATQDPVLRKRFVGTPENAITFLFLMAEEVREILAAMGVRRLDELIGQTDRLDTQPLIDHWKSRGLDFSRLFHKPDAAPDEMRRTKGQHHPIADILDRRLVAEAQPALLDERAGPDRGVDPQRRPLGRSHAVGRDRPALRARRPGGRHHHRAADRHGRAVLRRLPRPRPDPRPRRRRQRLCRQGPVGRPADHPPGGGCGLRAGREHHRRQHRALRRHRWRVLLLRHCRRALRGPQFRRHRGGGGRGRPRLRIHDRRHRRRHRQDGAQLRRRHVGRRRLRARRGRQLWQPLQPRHGRPRARAGRGRADGAAAPPWRRHRVPRPGRRVLDMSSHDEERLLILIKNHLHYTGSERARRIVENWAEFRPKFVKVMPVEYRRAIREMQEARMGTAMAAE